MRDSDQIKLTDEASRIMPVLGRGFEQCCNAQACVAANTMLVVAAILTQAPNDKCQVQPILNVLQAQTPQSVLGYRQFSLRGLRKFTVEWKADFEMPRPAGC